MLVERPRQAERLVPGGQLHRARPRSARQHHRQHFDQDAVGVVLRLLLGQAERVDLNAVAEAALQWICDAEAVAGDFVPELDERPHLREFGHEAHAGVDEERDTPDDIGEARVVDLARLAHPLEHRDRCRQRVAQVPAPASRPLPANGRSTRSSGSTSASLGRRRGSGPWSAGERRRAGTHRRRGPDIP